MEVTDEEWIQSIITYRKKIDDQFIERFKNARAEAIEKGNPKIEVHEILRVASCDNMCPYSDFILSPYLANFLSSTFDIWEIVQDKEKGETLSAKMITDLSKCCGYEYALKHVILLPKGSRKENKEITWKFHAATGCKREKLTFL